MDDLRRGLLWISPYLDKPLRKKVTSQIIFLVILYKENQRKQKLNGVFI
jgi:hypothetical protein